MKYTNEQRICKILKYAEKLNDYIHASKITPDDLYNDYTVQWLVTTPLLNIGEHISKLTKEYKELHAEIPWERVVAFRNRLVHDYEETNWVIVSDIIFSQIPQLIEALKNLPQECP